MNALVITRPNGAVSRIDVAKPSWATCLQMQFSDYYDNQWTAFYDEWRPDGEGMPREIRGFQFAGQFIEKNAVSEAFMDSALEALTEDYECNVADDGADDQYMAYKESADYEH